MTGRSGQSQTRVKRIDARHEATRWLLTDLAKRLKAATGSGVAP
jgi:hypothetical protein